MGGFAGGDEAGYWESPTVLSPKPKHPDREKPTIVHDETGYYLIPHALTTHLISFIPYSCDTFTIEGYDNPSRHPITLAYQTLIDATNDPEIAEFFTYHKVVLTINDCMEMPSYVAAFLHLTKEVCNLILSTDELTAIGKKIEANSAFFPHAH